MWIEKLTIQINDFVRPNFYAKKLLMRFAYNTVKKNAQNYIKI